MKTFTRLTAFLLAMVIVFSMATTTFALPVEKNDGKKQDVAAIGKIHDSIIPKKNQLGTMALSNDVSIIANDYLEFYVTDNYDESSGRFTIGNVMGNPNYSSDDREILLYRHPGGTTSYTTIRMDGQDYFFIADTNQYDTEEKKTVSTMTIGDIVVTQTLCFAVNPGTGLEDCVKISYDVRNTSGVAHNVGIRIMMDTMLGSNDGAPFKVPAVGSITYEHELVGNQIPQFWQAYDSLENPTVFAIGTLYRANERKPDRVVFSNWANVYHSSQKWSYQIDPGQEVTGDSAVSIYWNPVTVAGNGSTSVCTYYGVGYAVSGEDAVIGSGEVSAEGFSIQVVDEDGQPIPNVSVTAQNLSTPITVPTNESGLASFATFPGTRATTIRFKLEKRGYHTVQVERKLEKGGLTTATLYQDDGNVKFLSVTATLNGSSTDLLNNFKYLKENATGTTAASDGSNVKDMVITVNALSGTNIAKYQLLQGGEVKAESSTPTFTIPVFTGTPSDPEKYGSEWRVDKLSAGKVVTLRAIDVNGKASESRVLGLKISMPTTYGMAETTGSVNLGEKLKINVPSDIPILGDTEIELGWDGLPYVFEISEDGKVKFAVNPLPDDEEDDQDIDWDKMKERYNKFKREFSEGKNLGERMGALKKFGAGKIDFDADIFGYGEGYLDENGNIVVNVGLMVTVSEEGSYTWTFFLGYVPVYVSIGEKVSFTGSGQFSILIGDGNISVSGGVGEINPKITLNVDGGVGANGVLSIGASGRATLSWLHRWSDEYDRVDLTGGMYIVASAFLFKAEKKLAEGTWTIYDSYNRSARYDNLSASNVDFYNTASYGLMSRNYLNVATPQSTYTGLVKYGVYPDAAPRLVRVGDRDYLFWLEDIADRSAADRTALVYASSDDNFATWSTPVALFPEAADSTADYAFDLAVDGNQIHIALSKANTRFADAEVTLDQMAAASEVYYLNLDTTSGTVTSTRITSDSYANTMPAIAVNGSEIVVAYVENQMENGYFGTSNTQNVAYAVMGTTPVVRRVQVDGLISGVSVGKLSGQLVASYILDTDNDYNTEVDTQIWVTDGVSNQRLSGSGNNVASPTFARLNGKDLLFWYEAGSILYSNAVSVRSVFEDNVPASLSRSFYVLEGDALQIVWEAAADEEYRTDTNIYAVSYENQGWSPVFEMTETESELTSVISGYTADGNACVAYLKTEGVADDDPISTLCVTTVEPEPGIDLTAVDWDSSTVKPGEALPLTITVRNAGSMDVDSFVVNLAGIHTVTVTDAGLTRGETKSFTLDGFVVPADIEGPTTFYVDAVCESGDGSSDSLSFTLGYSDVAVTADAVLVNDHDCANIALSNNSTLPTDVILRIISDTKDGPVLLEQRVTGLCAGTVRNFLVDLTQISAGTRVEKYFIQAVPAREDAVPANNEQILYMAVGREKSYNLTIQETEGGAVSGEAGGSYTAGQEITITAIANPRYRFAGWQSSGSVTFADPTAETTTFQMPAEDVTIWAEFEDISINIGLNSNYVELEIGQTFRPTVNFSNGDETLLDTLIWNSSNPDVFTVDSTGLITAVGRGWGVIEITSTNELVNPIEFEVGVVGSVIHEVTDPAELESSHNYENNMDDVWIYTCPNAQGLVLKFSEETCFESGYDFLTISTGEFEQIGTYSSSELAGAQITVPGDTVRLRMFTDGSVTYWGFKVESVTVTNPVPVITRQPESVHVAPGKTASVSVEAEGEGLTYQWYFAEKGSDTFKLTTSFTGNTYSVTMNDTRAGRRVYCVITDAFGRTLQTETVTLSQTVRIVDQPSSVFAKLGSTVRVTVNALGDELTYQWYFAEKGSDTFHLTTTFTGKTYTVQMTEGRSGRRVYCVITDKYGKKVTSEIATIVKEGELLITRQPSSIQVPNGEVAKISVEAVGKGLKYQWYIKNAGATKYSKSSITSATYSAKMSATSRDRYVYCVVTDQHGNSVKSKTVVLRMAASITTQPKNSYTQLGSKCSVTVGALGDGLTYTWYVKDVGETAYTRSSVTKATYSRTMTEDINGRYLHCVVKDKYGNTVKSKTVVLRMAASITTQPKNTYTQLGSKCSVSVEAVGDGLTYTWYVKDVGDTAYVESSVIGPVYSRTMTEDINGRYLHCVVKDKYGNTVKSKTVVLRVAVTIIQQPTSVCVDPGTKASVTVKAVGDDLSYNWYYAEAGSDTFKLTTSFAGPSYTVTMTDARNGRRVYCVITDRYGKIVTSDTVTLSMK